jgi:hypothetical protein
VTNEADLELRAASDRLLTALDRLYDLETEKRQLEAGSRRFVELAEQIETLTHAVLTTTRREEALAKASEFAMGAGGPSGTPIEQIRPAGTERRLREILADWRAAERRLRDAVPGSADYDHAASEVEALRDEYRFTHEEERRRAEGRE